MPQILSTASTNFDVTLGKQVKRQKGKENIDHGRKAMKEAKKEAYRYVKKQVINLGDDENTAPKSHKKLETNLKTPDRVEIKIGQVYLDVLSGEIPSSIESNAK
jgi:hypothetical protein